MITTQRILWRCDVALLLTAAFCLSSLTAESRAQSSTHKGAEQSSIDYPQHEPVSPVGIGGQVGDPSGLSLKIYRRGGGTGLFRSAKAFSFLAAWDLEDFFFLNVHALHERPIPDSPLNYYIGPGAVIGIDDRPGRNADFVVGISGNFGMNFFTEHFEVFLELTPWIRLIPDTDGSLGGGIGLRYYF